MAKKTKESKESLISVLDAINKKYGKGTIQDLAAGFDPVDTIPSGSTAIDKALGCGGWPRSRIVELFGPESSGKSTVCLHAVAEAQKMGLKAAYIDVEHAMDLAYAAKLGVDTDSVYFCQPDYGEQALEIACMMVESGEFGVVVVDSVAALTPKAELEGEVGDAHVGLQARMMSQTLRKIATAAHRGNTLLMFVNQERAKIGGMGFGPKSTTAGGNALKYYASIRVRLVRTGPIVSGDPLSGNRVEAFVAKNKLAPPFQKVEFQIEFGRGIDQVAEVLDLAIDADVVEKSGAWISYAGERLGQGYANAKEFLREHPEMFAKIRDQVFSTPAAL